MLKYVTWSIIHVQNGRFRPNLVCRQPNLFTSVPCYLRTYVIINQTARLHAQKTSSGCPSFLNELLFDYFMVWTMPNNHAVLYQKPGQGQNIAQLELELKTN